MRRRWHGLTWAGWAVFIPVCLVLFGAVFWGTVKTAAVLDPGSPSISQSPAAGVSTASPPAKQHPRHPATHRASRRASPSGQARIPGVGSTGGPGVVSVPSSHRYVPPSHRYVPPRASTAPVISTPLPSAGTPAPRPAPGTETPAQTPAWVPTGTPPDTATAPAAAATSPPGWGVRGVSARMQPTAPASGPDTPEAPASTLPDVPGGGSGWIEGQ
jgi:translation initiation factor IF-2